MNQLFSGNALDVMQRDLGIFQAVITDPPYASGATLSEKQQGTAQKYTNTKHRCPFPDFVGDSMDQRSWMHMMRQVLEKARDKCVPGAALAIFIDWRNLPLLTDAVQWAGWSLRGVAVWDKLSSRPQRGRFRQQAEFCSMGFQRQHAGGPRRWLFTRRFSCRKRSGVRAHSSNPEAAGCHASGRADMCAWR